mgnify:CR=1 FL=1
MSQDMNDLFRNNGGSSKYYDIDVPFISGVLDLQLVRNIYMHGVNLTNFNTIGPMHESTVVKQVPVSSDFNMMIFTKC